MSDLARLAKANDLQQRKKKEPVGHIEVTPEGEGTISTPPMEGPPEDWNALLGEYLPPGIDQSDYEVDPNTIGFTAYDGWARDEQGEDAISRKLFVYRGKIRKRAKADDYDFSHWRESIRRAKPPRAKKTGGGALCVAWADWQIGGHPPDDFRDRFSRSVGRTLDRIRDEKPDRLYVFGLGDMVENCSGHYAMQTYESTLNLTQQVEMAGDAIVYGLKAFAPRVAEIHVLPIGGNHGEIRNGDGKAFTDFSDNLDVYSFRGPSKQLAENPDAFGHIKFFLPRHNLTQVVDVEGLLIGIAHGHQFPSKKYADQAADEWWRGQMAGMQPIGDATVLLAGHRHHLVVAKQGVRTFIQAPALDGGSEWFTNMSGLDSPPGTLTFQVTEGEWHGLEVL